MTTTGTWYPPAAGTGGFLLDFTNPPFAMTATDRIRAAIERCIDASPAPLTADDLAAAVLMEAAAVLFPEEPEPIEPERIVTPAVAINYAAEWSAWFTQRLAGKRLQFLAQQLNGTEYSNCQAILDSSTAPTDGPAVQGREPASVAPEAIEPAPPAEVEVAELVAALRADAECIEAGHHDLCSNTADQLTRVADLLEQLSSGWVVPTVEQLTPVPVSERLPGPEDCLPWPGEPNAGRWCWMASCVDNGWAWEQRTLGFLASFPQDFTHWLPASALPLPQGEVQP